MRNIDLAVQRHLMDNLLFSLFNYHSNEFVVVVPPGHSKFFQIEAGIGIVASISEMVFQDRPGLLRILPALPASYPEGKISGLRARGGFEVDISWNNEVLTEARIKSTHGEACRVQSFRPGQELRIMKKGKKVDTYLRNGVMEFDTHAGDLFTLTPKSREVENLL